MTRNIVTFNGNLTADPELRFTPSGKAVANFTLANTPRRRDPQSKEWTDGETLFLPVTVWGELAENVSESLAKGMRVIAAGTLGARSFTTKDGDKRTVTELNADLVGPDLKYATAKVTKVSRNQNGDGGSGYNQAPPPADEAPF